MDSLNAPSASVLSTAGSTQRRDFVPPTQIATTQLTASPVPATTAVSNSNPSSQQDSNTGLGSNAVDTKGMVESVVSDLKALSQRAQPNLDFSIDEETGTFVVKVIDKDSGEVIRQLPTEEALRIAEQLDEMRGLLFKGEA
ncbi:flagellar protein FlaG [Azomonas agilis]|uniref:Flagellar protein FlaG n=1 Tax=Azomonas agilis TaxID=116849 RepID=A0A562I0L2_9GAMM|nr:flagellar protein FlaG [Azomonas agilis]TWH64366.1 flagellar protein FlaG [Azomonas agilis]